MAIQRKIATGPFARRRTIAVADGKVAETEVWEGDYDALLTKLREVWKQWVSCDLVQNGPNGVLTLTKDEPAPENWDMVGAETITEVVWQELRQELGLHPAFLGPDKLSDSEIAAVREMASRDGDVSGSFTGLELKLYRFLRSGVTELPTGVPVVRRTTTKKNATNSLLGAGSAWHREEPPVSVKGDWEFLKTLDDRRRDGRTYTQVEEWTGATVWDPDIWP